MDDSPGAPKIEPEAVSASDRLDSWKEIASFLKKDPRTAQRWEDERGLPVHRYPGDKSGGVFAYKSEIETWLRTQIGEKTLDEDQDDNPPQPLPSGGGDGEPTPSHGDGKTHEKPPHPPNSYVRWVVLAVLAALLASLWYVRSRSIPSESKIKVMVRNLQNLSPGGADDAFSQGMTDQLITDLGKANPEQLGVLARTTADLYSRKTIAELQGLGVVYVIEGSVLRDHDRIRINTQLIDTHDGMQLAARSYEGEITNVLDLQRTAADDIVLSLKIPVKSKPQSKQVNPQAYTAYMRGQYAWNQRGQDSVATSLTYFKKAVELDPGYAPAYAAQANAYALLASAQYGILPPMEGFGKAKELAQRAIVLDPDLAAPHASMGYILLVFDRDPEAARQQFEIALRLDPNYVTAHQWYGQYYEVIGKLDQALLEIQKAYDRDPASIPVNLALAEVYYFKRDFDKAIEQANNTLQQEPTSALGHFNLGRAFEMKGTHDKSIEEFKLARQYAPNIATLVPLAYGYARAGDMATSGQYLNQLADLAEKQHKYVPAIYFAMAYIGRNGPDNALTWLARADRERCDYIVFLPLDPMVDPLRGDPRFEAIARLHPPSDTK